MAFNYISTEPIKEKIPDNMKYLFIAKEYNKPTPENGKKKCTKDQITKYNEAINKRNIMFKMLESGHYDVGNSKIELYPFINELSYYLENEKNYIYKINPINANKEYERLDRDKYFVSSFDVEKRIDNIYELIEELSKTIYYPDLFSVIFDRGHYGNLGYREHSIELFTYAKDNFPDKKIYLSECILDTLHSYEKRGKYNNQPGMEEYVKELLDRGLLELLKDFDDHDNTIINLIKAYWFEIAVDYIKSIPDDAIEIYLREIQKDQNVMSIIREHSDNPFVKELIELLNIEDLCIVLKVFSEGDYDDNIEEIKTFKDMNEIRGYVIGKYKVPFEIACKDIDRWHGENDEWFEIS